MFTVHLFLVLCSADCALALWDLFSFIQGSGTWSLSLGKHLERFVGPWCHWQSTHCSHCMIWMVTTIGSSWSSYSWKLFSAWTEQSVRSVGGHLGNIFLAAQPHRWWTCWPNLLVLAPNTGWALGRDSEIFWVFGRLWNVCASSWVRPFDSEWCRVLTDTFSKKESDPQGFCGCSGCQAWFGPVAWGKPCPRASFVPPETCLVPMVEAEMKMVPNCHALNQSDQRGGMSARSLWPSLANCQIDWSCSNLQVGKCTTEICPNSHLEIVTSCHILLCPQGSGEAGRGPLLGLFCHCLWGFGMLCRSGWRQRGPDPLRRTHGMRHDMRSWTLTTWLHWVQGNQRQRMYPVTCLQRNGCSSCVDLCQASFPHSRQPPLAATCLQDSSHSYGFLHRLDVPSSGLVLAAKTYEATSEFEQNIARPFSERSTWWAFLQTCVKFNHTNPTSSNTTLWFNVSEGDRRSVRMPAVG